MKKFYFKIIIIFLFLSNNVVYGNAKTHYIDLDYVLKNSSIGKNILKKIENLNTKNILILENKETELKKLEKEIKTKENIISKKEFDKEVATLKKKIKEYRTIKNKMVKNFEKQKNENLKNFFDQINPIIQEFMNNNSIDILLESKNVFIGKSNLDITKDIIQEIDKKLN